jgi:two-component system chemotaxis response regulator CheB
LAATPPLAEPLRRDIVVIGGSAGAIQALRDLVAQLPPKLAAAVFVVVHVMPSSRSRLPLILERSAIVPVRHAEDGDLVEAGRVLVAPPDRHLLVHRDRVELSLGPREHSTRPAVDPLFRSAAVAYGPRVCAVVLSGTLDDGSEGLRLVADAGGLAIVQDPREAAHPEMPLNALRRVPPAEVLTAAGAGRRVAGLGRGVSTARPLPTAARREPALPNLQVGAGEAGDVPTGLTCPECGGVLWADSDSEILRCSVGHRFSVETLQERQRASVEETLWASLRALREDASLTRHMEDRARALGSHHTAANFAARRRSAERRAEILGSLLAEREPPELRSP